MLITHIKYFFIVYDDACHLRRFTENCCNSISNPTSRLKDFAAKIFAVDKLHIQGHEAWCKAECHPKNWQELDDDNTVVCEQINFWLGGFKSIMRHQNAYRFNFFMYILLNEYNKIKMNGKYNAKNSLLMNICIINNRNLNEED